MTTGPAAAALAAFARLIDDQDWDGLAAVLAPGFGCRFVHTGEQVDAAGFVGFNRDYPGSWRFEPQEIVDAGERAVLRARVSDADEAYYVATFARTAADGRLAEIVEVWTGAVAPPPAGRRQEVG